MAALQRKSTFMIGHVSFSQTLGDWYFDASEMVKIIEKGFYGPLDKDGIPMVDYDKWFKNVRGDKEKKYGIHYTPVTIAHYALGSLWLYNKQKNENRLSKFLKMADWFADNAKNRNDFIVWEHTWYEPNYRLKPPWVSAMAQGEAISVLLRASQLTENREYFRIAQKAIKSFEHDLSKGGVRNVDANGMVWYEEYPSNPPSHVLNGFVFALLGIFDFYRITKDSGAYESWQKGILALKTNLRRYDLGYWSSYDLLERRAVSASYHQLHILQLKILAELTGENIFIDYAQRWESYANSKRKWIRVKIHYKIRAILRRMRLFPRPSVFGVSIDQ